MQATCLIQILLPLYTNEGQAQPPARFRQTRAELLAQFGGLTAYTRAPAAGLWQADEGEPVRDELIVFEVMTEELDRAWWESYRARLESRFEQAQILMRAQAATLL